ncbi:MAG: hypothetical protein IJX49_00700 [Clostridia bacterium]|nr:hypothetical protein [Clostridia bacterium]
MGKKIAVIMALVLALGCTFGCAKKGATSSSSPEETVNGITFESIQGETAQVALSAEGSTTYEINKDISDKNYIKLKLKTDVQLLGEYEYANVADPNQVAREEFFIEASDGQTEVEFKQFLDTFRSNAVGAFDKVLKSIKLTNKSGVAGNVTLLDVSVSDREFPEEEMMIFLEKGEMKIGADLATSGTLSYLERTSYDGQTVDEVLDAEGNVVYCVDGVSRSDAQHLSSSVNLVNIYDAGRQIQQSYYANVGGTKAATNGENGYTRGWTFTGSTDGYYWPYNPVQAGDCADNPGQVVDFEVGEDYIYVKARAMDWGKGFAEKWADKYDRIEGGLPHNTVVGGVTTKSYMENTYRIVDNVLIVENTFIDWNGFTDMDMVPVHTNELPATFLSQSLNTFVVYEGQFPWVGGELKTYKDITNANDLNHPKIAQHPEDWFAWVSEGEQFGVGVYVANVDYYSIGRTTKTANISDWKNTGAQNAPMVLDKRLLSNKPMPDSNHTSCYVFNTSYTAPVNMWTMREYDKMKYRYAISVDYISVMREQFKELSQDESMQNKKFDEWMK